MIIYIVLFDYKVDMVSKQDKQTPASDGPILRQTTSETRVVLLFVMIIMMCTLSISIKMNNKYSVLMINFSHHGHPLE